MDSIVEMVLGEPDSGIKEVVGRVIVRDGRWAEAIALAVHPDPRVAFRAAWALDWAFFHSPEGLTKHFDAFVEAFLISENGSVHRQYLRILADMQHRRIVEIDCIRLVRIAEKCFDLLICNETKAAVKAHCMDFLLDASPRLDWVGDALMDTLSRTLENNPSPGLANRASKILRAMARLR